MGPITIAVLWATTVLAANSLPLLISWLQRRWRAEQEYAHHKNLVSTAYAFPEGGQIREHRSDGTWTHLAVTRAGHGEDHHG